MALAVLLAVSALSACGDDTQQSAPPAAPPAPPPAVPTAPPSPSAPPAPEPTGVRSPEALAAQVEFTAPEQLEPLEAEAVAAYRDFVTQFVVAQGLPDGDYAPLLARIDPPYVERGLQALRDLVGQDELVLGTRTETVREVAGSGATVYLNSCSDLSGRSIYDRTTGQVDRPSGQEPTPLLVTLERPALQWVVVDYSRSEEFTCP